jgi:hypothetical protein
MATIDDNYIICPKEEIFQECEGFAVDLTKVRLKFQPGKSTCYITNKLRTAKWDSLWGDIPNESTTDADRNEVFGLAVYNVPVGSAAFVKAFLTWLGTHTLQGFVTIECLLDPGELPHLDVSA